jgi:hypothetical protein
MIAMKTSENPMPLSSTTGASGGGALGSVVFPGNDGEMLGLPPGNCGVIVGLICGVDELPGSDGFIDNPPVDGAGASCGSGSDGVGRLGVICTCASVTIPEPVGSLIREFPYGQCDREIGIERHTQCLADSVAGNAGVINQRHFDRLLFIPRPQEYMKKAAFEFLFYYFRLKACIIGYVCVFSWAECLGPDK